MTRRPGRSLIFLFFAPGWCERTLKRSQQKQRNKTVSHMETRCPPQPVYQPVFKMRPRRYERCSGDDRQRGQAERVSAAGSPSLKTGASRQPRHADTGRIRSRRLARHAARTQAHTRSRCLNSPESHPSMPSFSLAVTYSSSRSGLASPAMTSYQAFFMKLPAVLSAATKSIALTCFGCTLVVLWYISSTHCPSIAPERERLLRSRVSSRRLL